MQNRKLRVLVCGSTFGQFYCESLSKLKDKFELVGLLAQQSERSKKCAEKYNIALYHSVEELKNDIDIACVVLRSGVMGGKGSEISLKLLERGINVIQEQPIHYKDIEACIKVAKAHKKLYCVGDLYVYLPAVRVFIETTKLVLKETEAIYMDIGLAAQVSYPLMDILSRALLSLKPFKIKEVIRNDGPFHVVTAQIGNVPVIFQVHNEVNPDDPDNFMHYLHRITIGTNSGRVCLEDTQGPVYWYNKMHFPSNTDLFRLDSEKWPSELKKVCGIEIGKFRERSYGSVFKNEWVEAISENLQDARNLMDTDNMVRDRYYTQIISNARIWHQFTSKLGYATLKSSVDNMNIDIEKIKKKVEG